jgi:hypothetical protein
VLLWPFDIFSHFGTFFQEKSGSPAFDHKIMKENASLTFSSFRICMYDHGGEL